MNYGEYSRKYKIFCKVCNILNYEIPIGVNELTLNIVYDLYKIVKDFISFTLIFGVIAVIEFIVILFTFIP